MRGMPATSQLATMRGAFFYQASRRLADASRQELGTRDEKVLKWDFQDGRQGVLCFRPALVGISRIGGRSTALLRGDLSIAQHGSPFTGQKALEIAHQELLARGVLPVEEMEGSFTVAVIEHETGRIDAFRNLAGCGNTFYSADAGEEILATNLADLLELRSETPALDRDVLPIYFLFRYVPGRKTLVRDVSRLLPGEQATFCGGRLSLHRIQSLAGFELESGSEPLDSDPDSAVDRILAEIARDYRHERTHCGVLLSGGVDSSYLQAVWTDNGGPVPAFVAALDHPRTSEDLAYATTAANALNADLDVHWVEKPITESLSTAISSTGEPPNHVQAIYFLDLARHMVAAGVSTGVCGEAADGVFGMATGNYIQNAQVLRRLLPSSFMRRAFAHGARRLGKNRLAYYGTLADRLFDEKYIEHPVNRQAVYTDWETTIEVFGPQRIAEALQYRRDLVAEFGVRNSPMHRLHASNFFTSSVDSASYWTTLFNAAGATLQCPFLDSRLLRASERLPDRIRFSFRQPKRVLRNALVQRGLGELAQRQKRGFGQPIFEWLKRGNLLEPLLANLADYDFVPASVLCKIREKPNWFLYSLLCLDLWQKRFIGRTRRSSVLRVPT